MEVPAVIKNSLPYLEEVITGLFMAKGEVYLKEEELVDGIDWEDILFSFVEIEGTEGRIGTVWKKKDVASLASKILGMESEELTDELKDAFSEFLNQFFGRLRLELTKYKEDFNFTQPEIMDVTLENVKELGFEKFALCSLKVEEDEYEFAFAFDSQSIEELIELSSTEKTEVTEMIDDIMVKEKETSKLSPDKLDLILDIELPVYVSLGKSRMKIKDILKLGSGSLIELDRSADDYVDLVVNGKVIARGEVVVVESNFALRIKEIVSKTERIRGLRG